MPSMDLVHLFLSIGAGLGLLGTVALLVATAGAAATDLLADRPGGRADGADRDVATSNRPTSVAPTVAP